MKGFNTLNALDYAKIVYNLYGKSGRDYLILWQDEYIDEVDRKYRLEVRKQFEEILKSYK